MPGIVSRKINIRQATLQDVTAVSDILTEAARWLDKAGMPLWHEHELTPLAITPDVAAGLYHLAECPEGFGATLKFQMEDPLFWPEDRADEAAYVHRLAVRRQYAGTGLSTLILGWAVGETRTRGRRYLRLDCVASRPRLRAIYESFGFEHFDDRQVGPYFVSRYQYDVSKQTSSTRAT